MMKLIIGILLAASAVGQVTNNLVYVIPKSDGSTVGEVRFFDISSTTYTPIRNYGTGGLLIPLTAYCADCSNLTLRYFSYGIGDVNQLRFTHANGTEASPTSSLNTDLLAEIAFQLRYDVAYFSAAAVRIYADGGTLSETSSQGKLALATTPAGAVVPIDRFVIDSSGVARMFDGSLVTSISLTGETGTINARKFRVPTPSDPDNYQRWQVEEGAISGYDATAALRFTHNLTDGSLNLYYSNRHIQFIPQSSAVSIANSSATETVAIDGNVGTITSGNLAPKAPGVYDIGAAANAWSAVYAEYHVWTSNYNVRWEAAPFMTANHEYRWPVQMQTGFLWNDGTGNTAWLTSTIGTPDEIIFSDQIRQKLRFYNASGLHYGIGVATSELRSYVGSFGDVFTWGHGTYAAFTERLRLGYNSLSPATAGGISLGSFSVPYGASWSRGWNTYTPSSYGTQDNNVIAEANANIYCDAYANSASDRCGIHLRRAHNVLASPAIVGTGDRLGIIAWWGYGGSQFLPTSSIESYVTAGGGFGLVPSELRFATTGTDGVRTVRWVMGTSGSTGLFTVNGEIIASGGLSASGQVHGAAFNSTDATLAYRALGATVIDANRNGFFNNITVTGTCTGCGSAPNMVTTDTFQTITGNKTFTANTRMAQLEIYNTGNPFYNRWQIAQDYIAAYTSGAALSTVWYSSTGSMYLYSGNAAVHIEPATPLLKMYDSSAVLRVSIGPTVQMFNAGGTQVLSFSASGSAIFAGTVQGLGFNAAGNLGFTGNVAYIKNLAGTPCSLVVMGGIITGVSGAGCYP